MKNLRHPYIVELIGVCWDASMLACLLEFISNGSLEDHLKKDRGRPLSEKMTWKGRVLKVAQQCAAGVQYLHHSRYFDEKQDCWKECIIHRDLKPDNILVTSEPEFTAKLTDFGEARATELNLAMTTVGTPIFMAPEILRNDRYDSKVDVFSFGICLVAMLRCEEQPCAPTRARMAATCIVSVFCLGIPGQIGADERTRTFTPIKEQRPQRCASTNSATSALIWPR